MAAEDGRSRKRPGLAAQRQAVRRAAADLFMARGTRAVSISDICRHAEISRPTFYRCYPDKDALVAALYQQAINGPIQLLILEKLQERGAEADWMRGAMDAVFDAIFAEQHMALWLYTEASDRTSPAYRLVDTTFDQAAVLIEGWLYGADPVPPSTRPVLKSVMAACQWIARDAIESGLTEATRDNARQAAWVLVSGVREALQAGRVTPSG